MMATEILSAFLQLAVFTLIPFLVYLISTKKVTGFFNYIGFKKSNAKANLFAVLAFFVMAVPMLVLAYSNDGFMDILTDPQSMTGKFRAMGFSVKTVLLMLVMAVVKTALAEEILFRGFLAKRLIAITNFRIGNTLHAIIFGALHSLLFMLISSNLLFLSVIFIFPTIGAYLSVYINEKLADGSIIPGWISHSLSNVVSYSMIGFFL